MLLEPLIDAKEPVSDTMQLPAAMSTGAAGYDSLYYFVYWFSVVFLVGVTGAMLYFVVKYRRKKGVSAAPTVDSTALELGWTIAPLFFIVALFHMSFSGYIANATAAEGAMEVRVRGSRWSWSFQYPNGESESSTLYVPVNKPVRLVMSSSDVIHSFYVPAFRLKRDTVPGMYSQIAFTPNRVGEAQVYCAEYCGAGEKPGSGGHYSMYALIKVVSQEEFDKHMQEISGPGTRTPEEWGKELVAKSGCLTCHSLDGSAGTGPSYKGLYGRKEPLSDGSSVDVDENYVRESILRPSAKIVKGYENGNMPPFVFTDAKLDAIISYLKTVK
ncbi:MAG: cytochrome c oxidase subunit II [Polyangiaceae bacterium]